MKGISGRKSPTVSSWLLALWALIVAESASANPYLAKVGEAPTTVHVATCAVSGGFIHLYTAMDNGLFDKYGLKVDNKFISGSAMNLAALSADEVQFLYCGRRHDSRISQRCRWQVGGITPRGIALRALGS
jgi:ABC-type nitrate/sulfonate/bicarbonate transport system substrate-binding protein